MAQGNLKLVEKKNEHDQTDYLQGFMDYVNARWQGQDDYEQRQQALALEYCQSINIYTSLQADNTELVLDATKDKDGKYREFPVNTKGNIDE